MNEGLRAFPRLTRNWIARNTASIPASQAGVFHICLRLQNVDRSQTLPNSPKRHFVCRFDKLRRPIHLAGACFNSPTNHWTTLRARATAGTVGRDALWAEICEVKNMTFVCVLHALHVTSF